MTPDTPVRIWHFRRAQLIGWLKAEQLCLHSQYSALDDRNRTNDYNHAQAAESRVCGNQER
jgi:hypothetical protein